MTLIQRVFCALRSASMTAPEIAKAIDANPGSVAHACTVLFHLKKLDKHLAGYMIHVGDAQRTRHGRTYPVRQFGPVLFYSVRFRAKAPIDRRGKNPNSHVMPPGKGYARWIAMMTAKHGPEWRPKPRNGHPLDSWRIGP